MVKIDDIITVVKGMPVHILLSRIGNENGLGLREPPEYVYDFDTAIESFNLDRINKAIQEIPNHFTTARTYSKGTSYLLKHHLEEDGEYITNGDFIVAMILSGFRYKFPNRGVNAVFNCKKMKLLN